MNERSECQIANRRGATTTFSHSGLKNADAQTGVSQAVNATQQYDAIGNLASTFGTWQGQFGYGRGFGCQQDTSGLKLLGHRYYDASTGRFLTRDPIKDGRNWYVYCDSDPVGRFDLNGLDWGVLPKTPAGLPGGWWQGQHGGKQRVDGGQGRYFPPGGNEKGNGLEYHQARPGAGGDQEYDH